MNFIPSSAADLWALLAVVLAIPGVIVTVNEMFKGPQRAAQELLNAIPRFDRKGWQELISQGVGDVEKAEFLLNSGLDLRAVEATLESPHRHVLRALRRLVEAGKVEICIIRGMIDGDHPSIANGTQIQIPLSFKGGIEPSLRASDQEVNVVIKSL